MGVEVAVIIPTRGMIVSHTIRSVLDNLRKSNLTWSLDMPTGLTIPDCFNIPIQKALSLEAKHIWIVEEDVEVPLNGLDNLMRCDSDVAAIDYPFPNGSGCVAWYKGQAMWTGTGCTLIRRAVFDKMSYPFFRTDIHYIIEDNGHFREHDAKQSGYGGQDIRFGLVANKMGFSVKVVPNSTAKHWKMMRVGAVGDNNGKHEMVALDYIKKKNILKKDPLPSVHT